MAFTFFFRDNHTIDQATKFFLPIVNGYRKIKIWDAGCAHGPEPFTLAIMLSEAMGYFPFKKVFIDATDIDENDQFGKIINEGLYPYEELKRIPEEIFTKYFKKAEKENYFILDENIRNRLTFRKHDLLTLQPPGDNYNMILNKNVLLHFQPDERIKVMTMFHTVLATDGILVTEQTQGMPDEISHLFEKVLPDANIFKKV